MRLEYWKRFLSPRLLCAGAVASCVLSSADLRAADATGDLIWHKDTQRFDANIQNWPLRQVLEHIAGITGWDVECPESIVRNVSVKFKNLPESDALPRLLGNLSYAAVPTTNGVKLRIFDANGSAGARVTPKVTPAPEAKSMPFIPSSSKAPPHSTKGPSHLRGTNAPGDSVDGTNPADPGTPRSRTGRPSIFDRNGATDTGVGSRFGPGRRPGAPAPTTVPAPAPEPSPVPPPAPQ